MYTENDLLDSPTQNPKQPMPPPIVTFEKYFFPIIFAIQYFCLIQMAGARGFEALFGIMIGGALLFLTGVWQIIVGLVLYTGNTQNKGRRLYLILMVINVLLLMASLVVLNDELSSFFFAFVTSHALAWYYWWLSKKDSDLRLRIMSGETIDEPLE